MGPEESRRRSLSGEFDPPAASRALSLLLEHNLYGSLTVSDGSVDTCFFFTRGGLRVICAGRELPTMTSRLETMGKLPPEQLKKIKGTLRKTMRLKEHTQGREERGLLVDQGVPPQLCDEAARLIISEAFLDCLFWEGPQYEAATGEPNQEIMQRGDLSAITLSLGVAELVKKIQERIRTVSEMRRTVSSLQVVVEPTAKGREAMGARKRLGEGPTGARRTAFLKLVVEEPGMSALDIGQRLKMGELEVASRLHELATGGYLRTDRHRPTKEEELQRIRKMEEGVDEALSQLLRRLRLSHDSARAGDATRAARHMARAGGLLLQDGREKEAVTKFARALEHSPEDLEAREGYVQSLWATNRPEQAAAESDELGKRYLDLNLPGRAKRVLERALGYEERVGTLELLLNSLVKLKQTQAASSCGERLVNRLRREGRLEEAREVATRVANAGGTEAGRKIARATGEPFPLVKAAALVLGAGLIGLLYVPVQAEAAAREAYQERMAAVENELRTPGRNVRQLEEVLGRLHGELDELSASDGEVGVRTGEVREELAAMRSDCQAATEILSFLPWEDCENVGEVLERVQGMEPGSRALASPLVRLRSELERFQEAADQTRDELLSYSDPSGEALELAREMRERFAAFPVVLRNTSLRIWIRSNPTAARVRFHGVDYTQRAPVEVPLPLAGERELVLASDGYEPLERTVRFEDLGDHPALSFTLTKREETVAAAPTPRPGRDVPAGVSAGGETPRQPREQARPTPTPRRGVTVRGTPTPRPTPAKRQGPQVQLFDAKPPEGYTFAKSDQYFDYLKLKSTYHVRVYLVSKLEGNRVYLVGLRIYLYVRGGSGWQREKPVYVDLSDARMERPVRRQIDGTLQIQGLRSTLHFDQDEFKDQAKQGIRRAIRVVQNRRKSRR